MRNFKVTIFYSIGSISKKDIRQKTFNVEAETPEKAELDAGMMLDESKGFGCHWSTGAMVGCGGNIIREKIWHPLQGWIYKKISA